MKCADARQIASILRAHSCIALASRNTGLCFSRQGPASRAERAVKPPNKSGAEDEGRCQIAHMASASFRISQSMPSLAATMWGEIGAEDRRIPVGDVAGGSSSEDWRESVKRRWIRAFAGMTRKDAGMTRKDARVTRKREGDEQGRRNDEQSAGDEQKRSYELIRRYRHRRDQARSCGSPAPSTFSWRFSSAATTACRRAPRTIAPSHSCSRSAQARLASGCESS